MEQSMNKIVAKRTIRFWGYYVERMFGVLVGLVIFYSFFFNRNHVNETSDILLIALGYMMVMGGVLLLIMPMSYAAVNIPMILSMGASRKEALAGMQIGGFVMLGQLGMVVSVGMAYARTLVNPEMIVMIESAWKISIILLLLAFALGQFGAWLQMRFQTKGSVIYTIIVVVLLLAVAISVGIVVGSAASGDGFDATILIQSVQKYLGIACVITCIVSVLLYAIGYRLLKKEIMKYEVYR